MKYILFFSFIIMSQLYAMQQVNECNIKKVNQLVDLTGYWAQLNDDSYIIVTNERDKIICTRRFFNNGEWQQEEQQFPQWWFDKLATLYNNKQVQQNMELVIEKLKGL